MRTFWGKTSFNSFNIHINRITSSYKGGVPIFGKSTKKLMWKVTFLFDMGNSEWNSISGYMLSIGTRDARMPLTQNIVSFCHDLYLVEHLESHHRSPYPWSPSSSIVHTSYQVVAVDHMGIELKVLQPRNVDYI